MIEMQRTEAVLPTAVASVRLQTNPPGTDAQSSGRGALPIDSVPPPACLDHDAHATQFWAAIARLARNAVNEGRVPALGVGVKVTRNGTTPVAAGVGQRVGGGSHDANSPCP